MIKRPFSPHRAMLQIHGKLAMDAYVIEVNQNRPGYWSVKVHIGLGTRTYTFPKGSGDTEEDAKIYALRKAEQDKDNN